MKDLSEHPSLAIEVASLRARSDGAEMEITVVIGNGAARDVRKFVILTEQWLSNKEHLPAILGVATTAVCLIVFGAEYFIIPALLLISAELMLLRKRLEKPADEVSGND